MWDDGDDMLFSELLRNCQIITKIVPQVAL